MTSAGVAQLSGLLPDILIPFTRAHPKIHAQIVRDRSVALYERVLDGEIDAAITSHPTFTLPKTCGWCLLRDEPFVVLTPKSMRMRYPHEVLAKQPFIRLTRNIFAGQLIDNYLRKVGIKPKELFEIDGFELIAMMVDRGLGVSVLPDWPDPGQKDYCSVKCLYRTNHSGAELEFSGIGLHCA
jgi:DNA-binding transcriptional LysR family regulator